MSDRFSTLSESTEQLVLAALPNDNQSKVVFLALLRTGMRSRELQRLRWEDVNFPKRHIVVNCVESHASRIIPMTDDLSEMLVQRAADSKKAAFVLGNNPNSVMKKTLRSWHAMSKALCLPIFNCRDLRRTFAFRLANSGKDLREGFYLLGLKVNGLSSKRHK